AGSGRAPDVALAGVLSTALSATIETLHLLPPETELLDLSARGVPRRREPNPGEGAVARPASPRAVRRAGVRPPRGVIAVPAGRRTRRPPPCARPARLHRLRPLHGATASLSAHPRLLGPRVGPGSQRRTDRGDRRGDREATPRP